MEIKVGHSNIFSIYYAFIMPLQVSRVSFAQFFHRNVSTIKTLFQIVLKSQFRSTLSSQKVEVRIPIPPNTSGVKVVTLKGKAKYKTGENAVVWRYGSFYELILYY